MEGGRRPGEFRQGFPLSVVATRGETAAPKKHRCFFPRKPLEGGMEINSGSYWPMNVIQSLPFPLGGRSVALKCNGEYAVPARDRAEDGQGHSGRKAVTRSQQEQASGMQGRE